MIPLWEHTWELEGKNTQGVGISDPGSSDQVTESAATGTQGCSQETVEGILEQYVGMLI